jgi:hypothetical protein
MMMTDPRVLSISQMTSNRRSEYFPWAKVHATTDTIADTGTDTEAERLSKSLKTPREYWMQNQQQNTACKQRLLFLFKTIKWKDEILQIFFQIFVFQTLFFWASSFSPHFFPIVQLIFFFTKKSVFLLVFKRFTCLKWKDETLQISFSEFCFSNSFFLSK